MGPIIRKTTCEWPGVWQDWLLGIPYAIFLEPFTKKQSHSWHWQNYPRMIGTTVTVPGDPTAKPVTGLWSKFWNYNFGWKKVALIEPAIKGPYRVGFRMRIYNQDTKIYEEVRKICNVTIYAPVCALLVGDRAVEFFAINRISDRPVELKSVKIDLRKNLGRWTPLL